MKSISFIAEQIYIAEAGARGRGVFTREALKKNMIIEVAPVIVMDKIQRALLDQTLLHDYIFEWGAEREDCCMALGYVPMYNHSYQSNCEYEMDFRKQTISVKTVRAIDAGEELFINYNGDWNNNKKIWFDVK